MALLHPATLTPTKPELIGSWLPHQEWAAPYAGSLEVLGAYRYDDPAGQVGLETHLVRAGEVVLQVPLTYRAAPLAGGEAALVGTMQHSVLGERWVYDGCADPALAGMLAAATLTGVGQAAEVISREGRSLTRPPSVVLSGGGWAGPSVAVDGWADPVQDGSWTVLVSADLELRLARRPSPGAAPVGSHGLSATWTGQLQPVLLATVRVLSGGSGAPRGRAGAGR